MWAANRILECENMLKGVGHIGIFVKDLKATLDGLAPLFGGEMPQIVERPDRDAKYALVEAGPVQLEIIEPLSTENMVGQAVAQNGDHIHHICLVSDDMPGDLEGLMAQGVELVAEEPWEGLRGKKVIFTKPETSGNVKVEISEP